MSYVVALICVAGIAGGQLLFKVAASSLNRTGSFLDPGTFTTLAAAVALYGITTVAWVWVLREIDLGRVYPLMALSFVLVPLGSHLFFGERFQTQYFLGIALIVIGIIVATRA